MKLYCNRKLISLTITMKSYYCILIKSGVYFCHNSLAYIMAYQMHCSANLSAVLDKFERTTIA